MKSIVQLSIVALIAFSVQFANAQKQSTSEISFYFGDGLSTEILNLFSNATITNSNGTILNDADLSSSFSNVLTYKYAIKNRWFLGLSYGLQINNGDVKDNNTKVGEQSNKYSTIVIESDYRWLSSEKWQLYSGVGVGYTFGKTTFDKLPSAQGNYVLTNAMNNSFNFQVTGIGARFGKKLGVHAELGFGYKGVASLGISYQF